MARMRERMDSIHRTQNRPTVGLVLSGGGAKGAAHVGVLRYLEEQQIPIDLICGTSVGGLVGGFAALGYSSAYMDTLLRSLDWSKMLSDRIDVSYYSYIQKKNRETYNLLIPFHYSDKDFQERIDEQLRYGMGAQPLATGSNDLLSSLPSGYVYGFNVNNLLSSLSVGYQDDISFADLPIPFFCVATDIVSCKAYNWYSGSLKTAMRSTMSIPALFKPVRYNGTMLVDGGTRNNFPVDIARAMGCDIVIGVDLSDHARNYSHVNNLADIVMQFVTMLGKDSFDRNVGGTDVFIKPDLAGYNMMSFEPVAIDTMMHRGYVAAKEKAAQIADVKTLVKGAAPSLQARPATDIRSEPVQVYSVVFNGLTNAESRFLQRKIGFKAGSYVGMEDMERMMSRIQATECFSSLSYKIGGSAPPYRLEFDCEKGPRHQFGVGVRMDTEEWPSFLFNVGLNAYKLSGFKLDLNARVGRNQRLGARAKLDLDFMPTLNAEVRLSNISSTLQTSLSEVGQEASYWGHTESVYLSNIRWTNVDFQLGARNRYFSLSRATSYGAYIDSRVPGLSSGNYAGLFVKGTLFTQDSFHYPESGTKLDFGYDFDPIKSGFHDFRPLHTAYLNWNSVIPAGVFSIVPDLHLRALVGSPGLAVRKEDQDLSYSLGHQNFVGGFLADRCIEGQIPFVGFGGVYMARPYVAVLNLGLRLRAAERLYFTASGGYFREAGTPAEFLSTPLPTLWGASLEAAYNSIGGPVRLIVNWSDRFKDTNRNFGVYLSFGFDF